MAIVKRKNNNLGYYGSLDNFLNDLMSMRVPSNTFDDSYLHDVDIKSDIWETENQYGIKLALPQGLDPAKVDINVDDNLLTVSADVKEEKEEKEDGKKYHQKTISHHSFHSSFSLPSNVDLENVEAKHKNSILEIVFPKMQSPKAKKISIRSEE